MNTIYLQFVSLVLQNVFWMKKVASSFFLNYRYSIVGFFIVFIGYGISLVHDLDIAESIDEHFTLLEHYELDEIVSVWLVIFLFFVIIDVISNMERKKNEENKKIYVSMLYASNHIIRNLLNQIQIIRIDADENPSIDKEAIKMFDESIEEAELLISKLSEIESITEKEIYESIKAEETVCYLNYKKDGVKEKKGRAVNFFL